MGNEDIRREFSVEHPGQVIDILALMGDSAIIFRRTGCRPKQHETDLGIRIR